MPGLNIVDSNSIFRTATLCVSDPITTIVVCKNNAFLTVAHVNNILVDRYSQLEIDIKLLVESIVTIQFQICQLMETMMPDSAGPGILDSETLTHWTIKNKGCLCAGC